MKVKKGSCMYIIKKFSVGIAAFILSNLAYAEMATTEVNGYSVDYYLPDISKVKVPENLQMSFKVLIEDPTPLPEDYRPPKMNYLLTVDKATATTFTIDYIDDGGHDVLGELCYTFPEEAKSNFEAASTIWANSLDTDVPITIQACWGDFSGRGLLGFSLVNQVSDFTNAPISNTLYGLSLANSLAGLDLHPAHYDMFITYNGTVNWYYGTDGNTPSDKVDLFTVALHEIAHGLSFIGNMSYGSYDCSGTDYGCYITDPGVYDRLIIDGSGSPLLNIANDSTAMGDALTSGSLYFNGMKAKAANAGEPVKIYSPSTWAYGSSYSHLDYATFNNTSNQLMVYAISAGEAIHTAGDITLGMLDDMGWDVVTYAPINNPPVANAGEDQTGVVDDTVTLNGSGTDDDGDTLTYSWTLTTPSESSSVLSDPLIATPSFVPDIEGTYEATLIVNDTVADSIPDSVIITVVPIVTATTETVEETIAAIAAMDTDVFSNPNIGNALTNKLNSILDMIAIGEYQQALDKLYNDILPKTDGCALRGTPDKQDWIEDCVAQEEVYVYVQDIITRLESLI